MKGQLEELGEETDENVENISKMQGQILNMTKGKVNIFDGAGNFKSTYEIMKGIAEVWDDLSSIDQADLLETIAGKHRANDVAALLSNWQNVEDAIKSASEAEGSAARENAKYIDSIQGRLDKLTTVWQSFANTFMSSDFLKGAVSALTEFVELVEKLVKTLGTVGTIGLGAGIFGLFKNRKGIFGDLSAFGSLALEVIGSSDKLGTKFKNLGKAAGAAGGSITKRLTSSLSGMVGAIGLVVAGIGLAINAYKKHREEISKTRQEVIQSSDEFLNASDSFEQAYIKYSGRTDLTAEEEAELESAINGTVDALKDKSSALHGVVNSSNDYVAALEAITDAELKAAEKAAQEKQKNAKLELEDATKDWYTNNTTRFQIKNDSDALKIAQEMDTDFLQKETKGKKGYHVSTYWFDMPSDADADKILDYYYTLVEYKNKLLEVDDFDVNKEVQSAYEDVNASIEKLSETVKVYEDGLYDLAKAEYQAQNGIPKTTEEYLKMREAILTREDITKTSFDTRLSILNSLDSDYSKYFDLSSAEAQARKFVGIIKGFGDGTKDGTNEIGTVETFLNMRTAVNNNECTVGQYLSELNNVTSMSKKFSDEENEQFNLAFGLDTDSIKEQYNDTYNYIFRNYLSKLDTTGMDAFNAALYKQHEARKIDELLKGLSATELQAVANIKGEINWETTNTDQILAQIKKEAEFIEAMRYTISVDVETESLDALNSAISESVSATGLSSESIAALKGRYAELASQGYDLSAMFEETSNGIHLNKNAISEFEQALASQKLSETDDKLEVLKGRYDDLTKEIETCTDAGERAHLYSEQQEVAQKINDLATLASQYKGLTSAYNAWQNAESAGQERDMYESIIEGFENIGDEISRGWYDDGTIKFLELMTGKTDLAGKSASELKEIWNSLDDTIKGTSYSVRDFFTTDEDGNSTSTGAYNFLRAVEELGKNGGLKALKGKNIEDLIVRNDKGKIVEFDFDIVGGDKAIADALGVSEEMVQIIQRTLDDAGFVVTLDGKYTLLADLKTSAEEANNSLKKLQSEGLKNLKDLDLNFDFNVDTVEGYQEQLEKALNVLDKFRNKDGTLQTDKKGNLVEGAKQALEIAEYYTAAMDKLTEPKFMQIDTSTVDEKLQDPIEKMQKIGDLCKEKHLVSLTGDTKELDKVQGEIDKVAKEIEKLDPEIKAQIGIDEDWSYKEIADAIEKGEIEIPAELKLDVQMSEDLKDMRLLMMRQLGLISEEEVKLKVGYEIDESAVNKLTEKEQKVVVDFIAKNEEWFDTLTEEKQEIVVDIVAKNKEWFDGLSDEKREIAIELVAGGVDLNSLTDEEKEVAIKYVEENKEVWDKYSEEEKEAVVKLVADGTDIEGWEAKEKEALVKYVVDGGEVDGWSPEEKQSFAKYLVDAGYVDRWSPEAKDAFVKYLVDGGDPDKFDPDDKESWVVYKKDTDIPDSYIPINPNALVTYDKDSSVPDNYDPNDPDATVKYDKNSLIPDNYIPLDPPATVIFDKDTSAVDGYNPPDIFRTVYYTIKETVQKVASGGASKAAQRTGADPDGKSSVNGTANVNGTTGKAFKQGSWGTKNSGTALVGELGRETLVRDGRYYTIGDTGAEFIKYQRGDIIFNHKQTEELFRNGRVTSGGGRAKALVDGTAFTQGTAFSKGSGGGEEAEVASVVVGTNKNTGKSYTKSTDDSKDDFEELFDLIEIAISRIEREIDNLDKKANNVYKSWSSRNAALTNQISKVGDEIALQQKAYDEYMRAAAGVGLSSSWTKKIQNGEVDIETVKDEVLAEKIKDYQDYYESALKCKDAILELQEAESELFAQRFENIQTQYDGVLQGYEHTEAMLNEYIAQAEEQGYIVSKKYYQALIDNEKSNIAELKREQADLIAARDEAVDSGTIIRYSEDWYNMCSEIDSVTQSIEESTTALLEFDNAMREIDWSIFDLIQERISGVTAESEFLIELMSNKDLFDDDGKFTKQGVATMGLHALKYNTAMYQADDYGREVASLDKQIAKDPYDQELINRRNELLELQRESILTAEGEKNAIKDLVEEGINLELDALQERIDLHNEELDSMKDLYDYQKNVEEQTKNIASLRKQLSAYEGFDDEETRAKVQELKVSLEEAETELQETEYDKFISDQQILLDNLFLEYETILNTRLDNIDFLLEQVIDGINAAAGVEGTITSALGESGAIALALGSSATTIGETLKTEVGNVGTKLSTAMSNIWLNDGSGKAVLDLYGKDFQARSTTANDALNSIKTNIIAMVDDVDKNAQKKVETPKTKPSSVANPIKGNNSNSNKGNNNNNKQPSKQSVTDDTLKGIAAAIWVYGKDSGWGNNPFRENKLTDKLGASNAEKVQDYVNKYGSSGGLYKVWIDKNKNLSQYSYAAFATGARKIDETQLAWTQEGRKQEFIVRPSDGAILTPIAKDDSILNSAASSNIWNMANSPVEFIKDNLGISSANIPNSNNVNNNITQHFDNITFSMPNVHGYNDLLREMQSDPKFEKLVLSMTIDRIAGRSSLAKGKSIR